MVSNKKSGFTLVELMFFFLFVTLILAASTPLITKKFKEIPPKIPHGMFICYYDGNILKQDIYNAVKLIRSERTYSCSFKPPKKASLFKIELYGGGAGGYSYHEIPEDTFDPEPKGTSLTMSGGLETGIPSPLVPPQEDIVEMFSGATFQKGAYAGDGGNGGNVNYRYHSLMNASCSSNTMSAILAESIAPCDENYYLKDPDTGKITGTNTNSCQYKEQKLRDERNSDLYDAKQDLYPPGCDSCYYDYASHFTTLSSICAGWGDGKLADISEQEKPVVKGGEGGKGTFVVYKGTLDFTGRENIAILPGASNTPTAHLIGYMQQLWNSVTTGSMASTNSGFSTSGVSFGSKGEDSKNANITKKGLYPEKTKDGTDVVRHAAVNVNSDTLGYFTCYNKKKATGGTGAQIDIQEGGCIKHYPGDDGENAGVVQSIGTPKIGGCYEMADGSDIDPEMKIAASMNIRKHIVGNGGGAGKYTVAHTQTLPDDCEFNLGAGGSIINGIDGKLTSPESLSTTLVCNDGKFVLSALGGEHEKSTSSKSYNGYNWLGKTGEVARTTGTAGEASPYTKVKPFTIYEMPSINPGAGGEGATISDRCTQPYGTYSYTMEEPNKGSKDYVIQKTCTPKKGDNVDYFPAGEGNPGAIIITW